MVETTCAKQLTDRQTQFGNARILDLSECIFVFKGSQSDYEEPSSDEEVNDFPIISILHLYCVIHLNLLIYVFEEVLIYYIMYSKEYVLIYVFEEAD